MAYEWDEDKRKANIKAHGVDFAAVLEFDWDHATIELDDREDYRELRERATGFIGVRLHVLIFTRREDAVRVISLRKATRKEVRDYVKNQSTV